MMTYQWLNKNKDILFAPNNRTTACFLTVRQECPQSRYFRFILDYHPLCNVRWGTELKDKKQRSEFINYVLSMHNFKEYVDEVDPETRYVDFDITKVSGWGILVICTLLRYLVESPDRVRIFLHLKNKVGLDDKAAFVYAHIMSPYSNGHSLLSPNSNPENNLLISPNIEKYLKSPTFAESKNFYSPIEYIQKIFGSTQDWNIGNSWKETFLKRVPKTEKGVINTLVLIRKTSNLAYWETLLKPYPEFHPYVEGD